jgi:hypothetical protein
MSSAVGAIVAVAGTLLGSVATYLFQRNATDRQARVAREERHRTERVSAYVEFAAAATDLRRAAYDRWHRYQEEPAGNAFIVARDEYYRLYAEARNSQIKLKLLTGHQHLAELAYHAVEVATEIKDAASEPERVERGENAKMALDHFVEAASADLR